MPKDKKELKMIGKWADSRIKGLGWQDIALIKLSVMGFTLMLAKLWEPILELDWYWYAAIFLAAAAIPLYKVMGAK
jgi:hypothetical protein